MSDLRPDAYEILALSSGDRAVGIANPELIPPYQIVRVGLPVNKVLQFFVSVRNPRLTSLAIVDS